MEHRLATPLAALVVLLAASCNNEQPKAARKSGETQPAVKSDEDEGLESTDTNTAGKKTATDADKDPEKPASIFLLMAGGRGSCGNAKADGGFLTSGHYMRPALDEYLKVLRTRSESVTYAFTCFEASDTAMALADEASPDKSRSLPIDQLIPEVLAKISALKAPEVYIIGHSYGGWLSMAVARDLPKTATLAFLGTIDPISRITCGTNNFVNWGVDGLMNWGQFTTEIKGCDTFPSDFSEADRATIRASAGTWVNYFQTSYRILHSSSIPEASKNIERKFVDGYNKSHDDIGLEANLLLEFIK